jgi:hypothetical protein
MWTTGEKPPEKLHAYTNRIAGKGLHWKQDTDIETLEFYASVANTNFVELTRHLDDLSYVATSDYVLVDDRTFVYNRTECEFSGIHTCFVADLYEVKQIGVRFGFNEKDELEYYMFKGDGKMVGQLAYLEPFDEHGEKPMFAPATGAPAKGGAQHLSSGQDLHAHDGRTGACGRAQADVGFRHRRAWGCGASGRRGDGSQQHAVLRHPGRQDVHAALRSRRTGPGLPGQGAIQAAVPRPQGQRLARRRLPRL